MWPCSWWDGIHLSTFLDAAFSGPVSGWGAHLSQLGGGPLNSYFCVMLRDMWRVLCSFSINLIDLKCQFIKSISKHTMKNICTLIFAFQIVPYWIFFQGRGVELDKGILNSIWENEQTRIPFLNTLEEE